MTPLEIVLQLKGLKYTFGEEEQEVEFDEGLTEEDLQEFRDEMPNNYIPSEIEELLKETSALSSYFIGSVDFDYYFSTSKYHKDLFPYSIYLSPVGDDSDALVDINPMSGEWEDIWALSEESCFLYKWANSLNVFLEEKVKTQKDNIEDEDEIHEAKLNSGSKRNAISIDGAIGTGDDAIRSFAKNLEEGYRIYDLRNAEIMDGFSWQDLGTEVEFKRHPSEKIWAVRKKIKKSFWQRLFGK